MYLFFSSLMDELKWHLEPRGHIWALPHPSPPFVVTDLTTGRRTWLQATCVLAPHFPWLVLVRGGSAKSGWSESFPGFPNWDRRKEKRGRDAVCKLRTVSIHGSSGKRDWIQHSKISRQRGGRKRVCASTKPRYTVSFLWQKALNSSPSPTIWLSFLVIWFDLKSPNKHTFRYALILKFKSQRTFLFFLGPESATFRARTRLYLIHRTPAALSLSPAHRHAGPLSSPRPLHLLFPAMTFSCYFDTWHILCMWVSLSATFSEMLSLTTFNKVIFSNKLISRPCLFSL